MQIRSNESFRQLVRRLMEIQIDERSGPGDSPEMWMDDELPGADQALGDVISRRPEDIIDWIQSGAFRRGNGLGPVLLPDYPRDGHTRNELVKLLPHQPFERRQGRFASIDPGAEAPTPFLELLSNTPDVRDDGSSSRDEEVVRPMHFPAVAAQQSSTEFRPSIQVFEEMSAPVSRHSTRFVSPKRDVLASVPDGLEAADNPLPEIRDRNVMDSPARVPELLRQTIDELAGRVDQLERAQFIRGRF